MRFLRKLWLIILVLKGLLKMAKTIADKIDELALQVAVTESVEASVVVYVNGVPALIQAAVDAALTLPDLQAKLSDLQQRLHDSGDKVVAAILAAPQAAPPATPPAVPVAPVVVEGTGTVTDPNSGSVQ